MSYSIHFIRTMNEQNHLIISICAEKASDKIQHLFMIKTHKILGIGVDFPNLREGRNQMDIYEKDTGNTIVDGERVISFPLR